MFFGFLVAAASLKFLLFLLCYISQFWQFFSFPQIFWLSFLASVFIILVLCLLTNVNVSGLKLETFPAQHLDFSRNFLAAGLFFGKLCKVWARLVILDIWLFIKLHLFCFNNIIPTKIQEYPYKTGSNFAPFTKKKKLNKQKFVFQNVWKILFHLSLQIYVLVVISTFIRRLFSHLSFFSLSSNQVPLSFLFYCLTSCWYTLYRVFQKKKINTYYD